MEDLLADRRQMLKLSLGSATTALSALSVGASSAQAAAGDDTVFAPVDDAWTVHRKLGYSMDSSLTFFWMRGVRYAAIDSFLHPLWTMHIGSIFRTRDVADGYEVTEISTSFYTDLKTGAFIRKFTNPINQAAVDIGYYPPKPSKTTFRRTGRVETPGSFTASLVTYGQSGPAWIDGDTISVLGDHLAYSPERPVSAHPIRVNDLSTFMGKAKDVTDPAILNPPSVMIFNDLNTWPPWLKMGDSPGSYFSRAWGRKEFRYADMPQVWRQLMEQEYPAIAKDPAGALDHG